MNVRIIYLALIAAMLPAIGDAQQPTPPVTATDTAAIAAAPPEPAPMPPPPSLIVRRENVLARYGFARKEKRLMVPNAGVGRVWKTTISRAGAESLRFHFVVETPAPNWIVQISRFVEGDDVVAWTYSSRDADSEFWSDEIPGSRARIELLSWDPGSPVRIRLVETFPKVDVSAPLSITEPDTRWLVSSLPPDAPANVKAKWPDIQNMAKAVARIRFIGDDGIGYFCTGFMVSKDLMLTNDHCMKSKSEIRSALLDFDYLATVGTPRTEQISKEVARSENLDYALYRLKRKVDVAPLRLAAANAPAVGDKQQLLIIEHPAGEPKQVSFLDCIVRGTDVVGVAPGEMSDFGHRCDTLGGSSGSPVLDGLGSGQVAGLHHFGFTPGVTDPVNQAVRIQLIRNDLAAKNPAVAAEIP